MTVLESPMSFDCALSDCARLLAVGVLITACGYPPLPDGRAADASEVGTADDAALPADAAAAFAPLHVLPATMMSGAPDLVLSTGPLLIDTTNLMISGAPSAYFVRQDSYTVLFANTFSVQNNLVIMGASPLIVVASGKVTIGANISLNANGLARGPGAMVGGGGAGGPGATNVIVERESSGGGGGSYGTVGGLGGSMDATGTPPGSHGVVYGTDPDAPLVGGSPGGDGGFTSAPQGLGGAGGGALQISSAVSIQISGTLNAGGGGGRGGGTGSSGGGGGGSGGEILLEAPVILMTGTATLVANGGGGGGGGANGSTSAGDGASGAPSPQIATGGSGGVPEGSPGGAGAAGVAGAFADAQPGGGANSKGGGGGGGAGRIWLRYRATTPPTLNGAQISPSPGLDPTLP